MIAAMVVVALRFQQPLDRHQPDQLAPIEHGDVVGRRELAADQRSEHALGGLVGDRDRDAVTGVRDRGFEQLLRRDQPVECEQLGRRRFGLAVTHARDHPRMPVVATDGRWCVSADAPATARD